MLVYINNMYLFNVDQYPQLLNRSMKIPLQK
jgi:hypothetical protein